MFSARGFFFGAVVLGATLIFIAFIDEEAELLDRTTTPTYDGTARSWLESSAAAAAAAETEEREASVY